MAVPNNMGIGTPVGQGPTDKRFPPGYTGVVPPSPGFTGVVPPAGGFSGVVPGGSGGSWNGPNLSPLLVKEAVVNLRQAFVAQTGGSGDGGASRAKAEAAEKERKKDKEEDSESDPQNYFTILGLKKGATEDAIKKSYRKLVLQWHPDKHPTDREEAEDKIRKINSAYETLGNPVKREGYVQMLEAIERKKRNLRLDTSFIQPRMSIPKEFMLCPLGHPDKFVRAVGGELKVQSRDEVRANFNAFFNKAKFSLWWTPEVNNMCRLRTAESAAQGQEGGMILNFQMEGAPTAGGQLCSKDADCVLRANEDPRYSNIIAVASPFSPGAFRFEGAFWPGHYLSFRAPGTLCMAGLADEVKDITDFYLVDYSAAYKTMTVDEALLGPVMAHGSGDWVKLSDLRADLSVRTYFQNFLKCAVWNNREFEDFFEGHFEQWEFDKKRASVRPRSAAQQLAEKLKRAKRREDIAKIVLSAEEELTNLPVAVAESTFLRLLDVPPAVAAPAPAVGLPPMPLGGGAPPGALPRQPAPRPALLAPPGLAARAPPGAGLGLVPPSFAAGAAALAASSAKALPALPAPPATGMVVPPPPASLVAVNAGLKPPGGPLPPSVAAALRRMLEALPALCSAAKGARAGEVAPLPVVISLHRAVLRCPGAADEEKEKEKAKKKDEEKEKDGKDDAEAAPNGEKEEAPVPWAQLRKAAGKGLATLVSERLAAGSEKLKPELITELLGLPLEWQLCVDALCDAVKPMLEEPKPPGGFLDLLRLIAKAGESALPLAEAIARRELKALNLARGEVAVDVLLAMAEGEVLLQEVGAALREPVLSRLPLPELVRLVAKLGELRPTDDNLKLALETRIKPPIAGLGLAKVPVADLLRLAEVAQKSPVIEDLALDALAGAASLALKAWQPGDVVALALLLSSSKVAKNSIGAQEVYAQAAEVLAPNASEIATDKLLKAAKAIGRLERGAGLLEVAGKELVSRIKELDQAELLPLTEALLLLGAESEAVQSMLSHWVELLGSKEKGLPKADQVARLAELLAPVVPNNERVFQALGDHLRQHPRSLSAAGKTSLEAAFPNGEGPDFPGKEALLKSLAGSSRRRSRSRDRERGRGTTTADGGDGERGSERRSAVEREAGSGGGEERKAAASDRDRRREERDRDRDRDRERDRERAEERRERASRHAEASEGRGDDGGGGGRRADGDRDRRREGGRREEASGRARSRGRQRGSRSRDYEPSPERKRSRSRRRRTC